MSFPGLPSVEQAAVELPNFKIPWLEANVDLTAAQFLGVALVAASGAGVRGPAALALPSAGAQIVGVLQTNPQVAEAAELMQSGVSKAVIGAAVAVGAILAVDGTGKFVTATSGQYGVAQALQAGSASGQVITVLVANFGKQ